jgi:hypothetical protein
MLAIFHESPLDLLPKSDKDISFLSQLNLNVQRDGTDRGKLTGPFHSPRHCQVVDSRGRMKVHDAANPKVKQHREVTDRKSHLLSPQPDGNQVASE